MASTYHAEMFRPGSGARAKSGTLTVHQDRLVFTATRDEISLPAEEEAPSEEEVVELPALGLGCRLSGYDNRTFFFSHSVADGAEVAVKESRVATDETLASFAVFQEARRVGRATHRRFWGCIALLTLGAFVLLLSVGTLAAFFIRWLLSG